MLDKTTYDALHDFRNRLVRRYGDRLKEVLLFGSRARGDQRSDSDADVAVFLDQVSDPVREQLALVDESYPILLDTGLYIQPWVFGMDALLHFHPTDKDASLLESIRREGIRL